MIKRVKRGLPPVPTKAELEEIKREEAKIRREADSLIYGDVPGDDVPDHDVPDDDVPGDDDEEMEEVNVVSDEEKEDIFEDEVINKREENEESNKHESNDTKKSKKSVPKDYICQACQNKHTPLHWIYDCPDKKTHKGCNQLKKGTKSDHKLYISGLPFEFTTRELRSYLKSKCGEDDHKFIRYCKLLIFKDSKRCNGQAEVVLQNEDAVNKVLKLHGTILDRGKKEKKTLTLSVKKAPPRKKYRK